MEISDLVLHHGSSVAQDSSMEQTATHPQSQATAMLYESLQKQPIPGNYCPTPPGASPVKDPNATGNSASQHGSPMSPTPKHVSFELLLDDNSKVRARIPMRVQIFQHDTTDSIVTTVKNFYGIYEATASGVSFEDENGTTLIARYENLRNNMTVYVRVIPRHDYPDQYAQAQNYASTPVDGYNRTPSLGEPFQMQPAQPGLDYGRSPSRPVSRVSRKRSASPGGRGRRSGSTQKASSRAGNKSRGSSTHGSFHEDIMTQYSDSDGTHGSIAGSRKARSEQFASSEISMENILMDGRRKRPKFDSSELPLFAPPQVPLATSASSLSPQRRSTVQEAASPFAVHGHYPFAMNQPLPSPQSFGHHENLHALHNNGGPYATPTPTNHGHRLRDRTKMPPTNYYPHANLRQGGSGILPTPDPTIASCISDEDVAMQLIRLGDASNFSHGRLSASTADDAFSGIVDASSSVGATSDAGEVSEDEDDASSQRPKLSRKHLDDTLASDPYTEDGSYPHDGEPAAKRAKSSTVKKQVSGAKTTKNTTKPRPSGAPRKSKGPAAPTTSNKSMGPPPLVQRSASGPQNSSANGDEDLSTKPRCQRCRKSKKGCDRQRPCQRCKDAGIGIEGCISEDEGNGRKGRYGRHMGVPLKPSALDAMFPTDPQTMPMPMAISPADKNKKRKR